LASARSAGRAISFGGRSIQVQELGEDSFAGVDIVLASAGGGLSKRFNPHAVAAGAVVVDNTSAYRMDPDVPLVVPEINPEDLAAHRGIIANPNCSTIIMDVVVWPLYQRRRVQRIVVSTYQAVSGAGARAMQELEKQTRQVLAGQEVAPAEFPHPIAFNLFSHDSPVGPAGYCEEELKRVRETRKMFHDNALPISATTIRVPVLRAHSEAINVEFAEPFPAAEAEAILAQAAGVRIVDGRVIRGEEFDCLVHPGRAIPPASTEIHHITDAMVADAPPVAEACSKFADFAEGAVLVAHPAQFDMAFLKRVQAAGGATFDHPVLCTGLLSQKLHSHTGEHTLDALAERYGVIRAQLRREGRPIGANDLMSASIAVSAGLTLATRNTGEFSRVPGLDLDRW